ncbi:MAG: pyridoxal phosphate-dependent aminotransferase, partial [Steroidobacteraceae bacterium]
PAVIACAAHLGVDPEWVLLTNGLDEGLLMLALARLGRDKSKAAEAIVPTPAFDPYFAAIAAVGATAVRVPPLDRFRFPLQPVLDAISPQTRLIYLNTPNNPTGQAISRDALQTVIESAPAAAILVDEAYVEFGGTSFIEELPRHRNAVVGRTFSKAYGLAGMRIGCLVAHPDTLDPVRAVTPVLNLNTVAVTAVQAALRDTGFLPRYAADVRESKRRLYGACARLGLDYWESEANFVLVRVGERAADVVQALAARGVHVRDRSKDAVTAGCVRITAGVVAHTEEAISALEAVFV